MRLYVSQSALKCQLEPDKEDNEEKCYIRILPKAENNQHHRPSDRRVIYCLLCQKPQRHISTHLARCCMKGQSPSEQQKELQRAKCSMKAWTLKGRRWDYRQLSRWCADPAGRYELLNHLREAGFFVLHPPDEHELSTLKEAAALAEEAAEPESAEPAAASAEVSVTSLELGSASGSEEEPGKEQDRSSGQTSTGQTGARKKMKGMGMYRQVSLDDPLLKSYRAHLAETLNISKSKQEIANVARWLHFLLPLSGQVSAEFVRSVAKVGQYVKNRESAQLGRATITTYIEHMLRFTAFVRERSNPEEAADCEIFIQALKSALQNLGSKDERSRSPKLVVGPATTLRRCQGVIFRAEEEMQKLQKNLDQDSHVTEEQRTRYRYYCQVLLILKLCLKPSVVENLTAKEWLERIPYGDMMVVVHHAVGKWTASFALFKSNASLLETYFNKVRAGYIQGSDVEDVRFFLTRSGSAIKSAHVELSRLHLQNTGSLQGKQAPKRRTESSQEQEQDLGAFLQTFPVGLDGRAPTKKKRQEKGFSTDRSLYNAWRSEQYKQRHQYLKCKSYPRFLATWKHANGGRRVGGVSIVIRNRNVGGLSQPNGAGNSLQCNRSAVTSSRWAGRETASLPMRSSALEKDEELIRHVAQQSWTGLVIAESRKHGAGRGGWMSHADLSQLNHS
ncbi:uncharacterized protein LOC124861253 isoform X2 [Girardinichthys multiradiatus]|uniref:uncharacterized protein LOC124861253 isoform X2 n=1 Tax=Girardinichthys multiradiatus TaxID=208333 RepID=UPI001FADE69B|nr:uncharacterized protein LOC124861253 isoform X2 [Girardinichthys multiradiatus]